MTHQPHTSAVRRSVKLSSQPTKVEHPSSQQQQLFHSRPKRRFGPHEMLGTNGPSERRISGQMGPSVVSGVGPYLNKPQKKQFAWEEWQSKALYYRVLVKERMEPYQDRQYRHISLAQFSLDLLEELGSQFAGYKEVFQGLASVFSSCIFSDQETTLMTEEEEETRKDGRELQGDEFRGTGGALSPQMRVVKIPFFQLLFDNAIEFERGNTTFALQLAHRRQLEANEKEVQELKKELAMEREKNRSFEHHSRERDQMLQDALRQVESSTDQHKLEYEALSKKYERLKRAVNVMRSDLTSLRQYKRSHENAEREYRLAKKMAQGREVSLLSIDSQLDNMHRMSWQLEAMENTRIGLYQSEISRQVGSPAGLHVARSTFANDMVPLSEELDLLRKRTEEVIHLKNKRKKIEHVVQGDATEMEKEPSFPLRDVDSSKFVTSIEILVSRNDQQSFDLLHRANLSASFETVVLPVTGSNITHIKMIQSKWSDSLKRQGASYGEDGQIGQTDAEIPDTSLWELYRQQFGRVAPHLPRALSLMQVREMMYRVYMEHSQRKAEFHDGSIADIFTSLIGRTFVVPGVAMKVLYEYLSAVEKFAGSHFDVLEFVNNLEESDPACGLCMAIALAIIRTQWLDMCDSFTDTLSTKSVVRILQVMYIELKDQDMKRVVDNLLEFNPHCARADRWSMSALCRFFIASFRDTTEHWCEAATNDILNAFADEKVSAGEFVDFARRSIPEADPIALKIRYNAALRAKRRSKSGDNALGLGTIDLALLIAEHRWEHTHRRLNLSSTEKEHEFDPETDGEILRDQDQTIE